MSEALAGRLRDAVRTIQALRERVAVLQAERAVPVAVVGIGCRYPGADDATAFWRVLAEGRDMVRPVPADRWDNATWHDPDPEAPGRISFREGAFLDDVDGFDHALFGIAAREAETMDPQHRLLLETAWAALEDAAIAPGALPGTAAGVFLGLGAGDHMQAVMASPRRLGAHALAGAVPSLAAGRIAYALGLTGPAMVVDTACSSSLVAVHLAVRALRGGECDLALAGGVHLMLAPAVSVALSRARMMSPDGRCKAFDAGADGFGQGEGCGMVALKRLPDALAAGDPVLAVIRGSALNQDGRSAGITAPNGRAQAAVIRAALADAGLEPGAVDAIEAHGTGTSLGDPVELRALAQVYGAGRTAPLRVGSVKTNIGHTAAAAGVAGLIKAVLMLRHQAVPPSLHFRRLNPHAELDGAPVEVPTTLQASRLSAIGVSSFGFSGTNAHVVLERAPEGAAPPLPRAPRRFARRAFARLAGRAPAADAPPYPGRPIETPSADRQLECVLDVATDPWLADHRVGGRVVVPGAVLIGLMLAAAPPGSTALEEIRFHEPAVLEEGAALRVVALARPDGTLEVASRAGEGWLRHATARLAAAAPAASAQATPGPWLDGAGWVARLAALGIGIGPAFQGIARIAPGAPTVADLAPVAPAPAGAGFHPALLDAVLQVAGGCLPAEPVLPVGIARLILHAPLDGVRRVVAQAGGEGIALHASDAAGQPVATVEGLAVRRLGAAGLPVLAALRWQPAPPPAVTQAAPTVFEVAPAGANLGEALDLLRRAAGPVVLVTRGAAPPVSDPGAALFHGLASALAEERPELGLRCVDVAPGTPDALLAAEIAAATGEPLVALRPDGRFVPRLLAAAPPAATVRLRGTVLVTGGFGGIGRHVAAWAAERGAEALLLVGRRTGDPPETGVPAHALALDIAAPAAEAALRAALRGLPPLRSVIHAAGVLRDGLLEAQDAGSFAASLGPKLGGAQVLHALTRDLELDHFLLFGSVGSLIGAAGQANYAAANAALDAFAEWRRAQGLPAIAIAWGRWAGTGMAAGLDAARQARVSARGVLPMAPARALAALDAAIALDAPRAMVAALDHAALAASAPPVFSTLLAAAEPAPAGDAATQVAAMVRQILGQDAPADAPLVACGMDSLMAMDLRNRLNRRFGLSIGLADIMGGADLAALVARVEAAQAETEELTL